MPVQDFVDVRIRVLDERDPDINSIAAEYEAFQNEANQQHEPYTRYIDAKTGQRFQVVVTLLKGFKFRPAKCVYIQLTIDNDTTYTWTTLKTNAVTHRFGILTAPVAVALADQHFKDEHTGQYTRCDYSFGVLGTNDDINSDLSADAVALIGSIRVKVFRAQEHQRQQPEIWNGKRQMAPDVLPERMLKGGDIKNAVRYCNPRDVPPPEPRWVDYFPVRGKAGKEYHFKFLYRTRRALQRLELIPREPSPTPDPELQLARAEDRLRTAEQQQIEDRKRIARLEARLESFSGRRSATTDSEAIRQSSSPTVKREHEVGSSIPPVDVGLNRKRACDEEDDDVQELEPPPQRPRVEIDLTGDDDA